MSLPRRPKAVVFDLDGTLIDSEALVKEAYLAAAEAFAIVVSDEQFHALVGLSREASEARMREIHGAHFPIEDFYAATRAHIGGRVAPLKPGAAGLLDLLDQIGLPYGLATSSGRPWLDKHFEAHGLGPRFRAVLARGDYENGKPHPEPYLKAAAALGAAPMDALAIEDSHTGVRSAHAAGLMTIMAPDLLAATEEMHAKALVVDSLTDVAALIRAFGWE